MDGGTFTSDDGNLIDSHSNSVKAVDIGHNVHTLISESVQLFSVTCEVGVLWPHFMYDCVPTSNKLYGVNTHTLPQQVYFKTGGRWNEKKTPKHLHSYVFDCKKHRQTHIMMSFHPETWQITFPPALTFKTCRKLISTMLFDKQISLCKKSQ